MKTQIFIALLFSIVIFSACEKDPGRGGTSTIRGKVMIREYNGDFTILRGTYPGAEVDVYIIYGDELVHSDRYRANYDGIYEFRYLREGDYTVFAYSKDSVNRITSEKIPVIRYVEITEKNQIVEVPDIYILK